MMTSALDAYIAAFEREEEIRSQIPREKQNELDRYLLPTKKSTSSSTSSVELGDAYKAQQQAHNIETFHTKSVPSSLYSMVHDENFYSDTPRQRASWLAQAVDPRTYPFEEETKRTLERLGQRKVVTQKRNEREIVTVEPYTSRLNEEKDRYQEWVDEQRRKKEYEKVVRKEMDAIKSKSVHNIPGASAHIAAVRASTEKRSRNGKYGTEDQKHIKRRSDQEFIKRSDQEFINTYITNQNQNTAVVDEDPMKKVVYFTPKMHRKHRRDLFTPDSLYAKSKSRHALNDSLYSDDDETENNEGDMDRNEKLHAWKMRRERAAHDIASSFLRTHGFPSEQHRRNFSKTLAKADRDFDQIIDDPALQIEDDIAEVDMVVYSKRAATLPDEEESSEMNTEKRQVINNKPLGSVMPQTSALLHSLAQSLQTGMSLPGMLRTSRLNELATLHSRISFDTMDTNAPLLSGRESKSRKPILSTHLQVKEQENNTGSPVPLSLSHVKYNMKQKNEVASVDDVLKKQIEQKNWQHQRRSLQTESHADKGVEQYKSRIQEQSPIKSPAMKKFEDALIKKLDEKITTTKKKYRQRAQELEGNDGDTNKVGSHRNTEESMKYSERDLPAEEGSDTVVSSSEVKVLDFNYDKQQKTMSSSTPDEVQSGVDGKDNHSQPEHFKTKMIDEVDDVTKVKNEEEKKHVILLGTDQIREEIEANQDSKEAPVISTEALRQDSNVQQSNDATQTEEIQEVVEVEEHPEEQEPQWLCQWDQSYKAYYYVNTITGEAQWEWPGDTATVLIDSNTTSLASRDHFNESSQPDELLQPRPDGMTDGHSSTRASESSDLYSLSRNQVDTRMTYTAQENPVTTTDEGLEIVEEERGRGQPEREEQEQEEQQEEQEEQAEQEEEKQIAVDSGKEKTGKSKEKVTCKVDDVTMQNMDDHEDDEEDETTFSRTGMFNNYDKGTSSSSASSSSASQPSSSQGEKTKSKSAKENEVADDNTLNMTLSHPDPPLPCDFLGHKKESNLGSPVILQSDPEISSAETIINTSEPIQLLNDISHIENNQMNVTSSPTSKRKGQPQLKKGGGCSPLHSSFASQFNFGRINLEKKFSGSAGMLQIMGLPVNAENDAARKRLKHWRSFLGQQTLAFEDGKENRMESFETSSKGLLLQNTQSNAMVCQYLTVDNNGHAIEKIEEN
eukprot:g115.t1